MLDIKVIRENPEKVKASLARRCKDYGAEVDRVLELDARRREIIGKSEAIKASQNAESKKIPMLKKAGEDTTAIFAELKKLGDEAKALEGELRDVEEALNAAILVIPNTPNDSIPDGPDSDSNVEVRRVGTPREFDFTPKAHWDLGDDLGILDPTTAAKVTGTRFHFYKGAGAALERAVINFYLDTHTSRGYTEIFPPFMVNRASMTGTGQLPKFEEDAFHLGREDYFLIPTAEVPVTNIVHILLASAQRQEAQAAIRADSSASISSIRLSLLSLQIRKIRMRSLRSLLQMQSLFFLLLVFPTAL